MRTAIAFALGFFVSAAVSTAHGLTYPPKQISDEGTLRTFRPTLDFTGAGVSCVDDSANNRTQCTISGSSVSAYDTVQDEGTPLTQRTTLNFTGTGVSCADNAGSSRTDCTISGGGGGLTFGEAQRLVYMAQ